MSKYKEIRTEFRNANSLRAALADVCGTGYHKAPNVKANTLPLYGYVGDERPERCAFSIPQTTVNRWSGGASNDVGFAWDGTTYVAIMSEYDQSTTQTAHNLGGTPAMLKKIQQRYAYHEVRRQAAAKGYTIREQNLEDGSIVLTCVKR